MLLNGRASRARLQDHQFFVLKQTRLGQIVGTHKHATFIVRAKRIHLRMKNWPSLVVSDEHLALAGRGGRGKPDEPAKPLLRGVVAIESDDDTHSSPAAEQRKKLLLNVHQSSRANPRHRDVQLAAILASEFALDNVTEGLLGPLNNERHVAPGCM